MKRSPMPPRRARLARGPIRAKKRTPSEFARIYGSRERVQWVKTQPCIAALWGCVGPMVNAHTETGGTGRKGPYQSIVPACDHHHREMHRGVETFQRVYRVDLAACARATEAAWREFSA